MVAASESMSLSVASSVVANPVADNFRPRVTRSRIWVSSVEADTSQILKKAMTTVGTR